MFDVRVNMASNSHSSRTVNLSKEEKLLLAELSREFPEVEGKGYDNKTLTNKAKAWDAIPSKFNSQNTSGIKRDMNKIQGCWKRMKIQTRKSTIINDVNLGKPAEEKLQPPQVKCAK